MIPINEFMQRLISNKKSNVRICDSEIEENQKKKMEDTVEKYLQEN